MKVILNKDVDKLGEQDSLVNVSEGYARNYLIPRRLAVPATKPALIALEKRNAAKEKKLEAMKGEFEELAQKISALEVTIHADAGEGGRLFGSVTGQDIAAAVKQNAGLEIDKKKIELKEPLKVVGQYKVQVKIYKDINAELKVVVEPQKQ